MAANPEDFKIYRRRTGWSTEWYLARPKDKAKGWEYIQFQDNGYIKLGSTTNRELIRPFFRHDQTFNDSMLKIMRPLIEAFNRRAEDEPQQKTQSKNTKEEAETR